MLAFKIGSIAILTGVHAMAKEVWHCKNAKKNLKGAKSVRDACMERLNSGNGKQNACRKEL
jgi:hypothetical protein